MVIYVTNSRTVKLPKYLRLVKPTNITIHWKALEEHFLMVPLVFRFNHFHGKIHFQNFSQKPPSFKLLSPPPPPPHIVTTATATTTTPHIDGQGLTKVWLTGTRSPEGEFTAQ
jgi:hypothetical protein